MSVLETAENKRGEKLLRRIRDFDFFFLHEKQVFTAAVAGSIREAQLTGGVQMNKTREDRRNLKSHRTAFMKHCDVIGKKIIHGQRIMKLSDSCERYVSALEETKHSKPGYKAEKLKKKLEKSDTYGQTLPFCSLNSGGSLNCTLCTILT